MVHVVTDVEDFNAQLEAAGDKLVVIDFHAKWCPPCKLIAPFYEQLSKEYENVVFLKIDVDEVEEVAVQHNVSSIPKFVLLKSKQKVSDMSGADKSKLKKMILENM